jgi:hypothetical protein
MNPRQLRLLLCTAAVVALGAGTWSIFAVHPDGPVVGGSTPAGVTRNAIMFTQEPTRVVLDAIGSERSPSAAARDSSSAVLAAGALVGLVALLWCSDRRVSAGVRGRTILAAAPRGPPGALWT